MPKLTHEEEQALRAIQDAFDAINSPALTLGACFDYCPISMNWDQFADAVKGLCRLRLVQMEVISRTPRLYLTSQGRGVAA